MKDVEQMLPQGMKLLIASSGHFDDSELKDPEALMFGCEGDYDAWTVGHEDEITHPPASLRSAGGHVHIGFKFEDEQDQFRAAKAADLFIGLRGVFYDKDSERRQLYGRASKFRLKPYGIEYRTPSNYWVASKELTTKMFQWAQDTINNRHIIDELDENDIPKIKQAINTGDEQLAQALLNKYNIAA